MVQCIQASSCHRCLQACILTTPAISMADQQVDPLREFRILSMTSAVCKNYIISHRSPNKLNATKKPMISNNNNHAKGNGGGGANFVTRNRNSTSPNVKNYGQTNSYLNNYNTLPANNNNGPNQYSSNSNNIHNLNMNKLPMLNSNGFGRRPNQFPISNYNTNNLTERTKFCMNHPNKQALYTTQIQSQQNGYCKKCATNLASKGFSVISKYQSNTNRNYNNQKPNNTFKQKFAPFYNPQYVGLTGYSQIQKLIANMDAIYEEYLGQMTKYQTIQQHYEHQIMITQQFYQSLLDTVQQMKQDHLQDLQAEGKKHYQLALIKQDNLKSDAEEMEVIRKDLIQNLDAILSDFNTEVVQDTLKVYKQQIYAYKSKIEDQTIDFEKQIINQKEKQLENRLKCIQEYLLDVWNDKKPQNTNTNTNANANTNANMKGNQQKIKKNQDRSPKAVKNIIYMNGRSQQQNNRQRPTACRKLFEDQNEFQERKNNQVFNYQNQRVNKVGQDLASPQFKNI